MWFPERLEDTPFNSYKYFFYQVYGQSPAKPYFPCVSDVYEGKVKHFVRDASTNTIIGIFIDALSKKLQGIYLV